MDELLHRSVGAGSLASSQSSQARGDRNLPHPRIGAIELHSTHTVDGTTGDLDCTLGRGLRKQERELIRTPTGGNIRGSAREGPQGQCNGFETFEAGDHPARLTMQSRGNLPSVIKPPLPFCSEVSRTRISYHKKQSRGEVNMPVITGTIEKPIIRRPERKSERSADLRALTGIRFLAAFYVVLFHSKFDTALIAHGHRYLATLFSNGIFAVQLFFMLSGFILAYSYSGKVSSLRDRRIFWEARFARVWPLYALSLIFSSFVNHTTPTLLPALATLAMVQSWSPFGVGAGGYWNFVCWTLSCEAFFYLLFPFVQQRLEKTQVRTQCCLLTVSLIISAVFCVGSISFATPNVARGIPLAVVRLPDFIAGVCLGNLFSKHFRERTAGAWCTSIGLLGALGCLVHAQRSYLSMVTIFVALLLFGLATERSAFRTLLSSKLLLLGGGASYAMYLFQWPIKYLIKDVCSHVPHMSSVNERFILYIVALTIASYFLYSRVEEPAPEGNTKRTGCDPLIGGLTHQSGEHLVQTLRSVAQVT